MSNSNMDQGEGEANTALVPPPSTLLPTPVANVVSLVTRSSSLYLRLGTFIGGLALDGARITTLTGLELSRAVIEGILHRAGRDVATRSTGELGQAEAEGLLERSIGTLHSTITSISFAASTGFHFSSTILNSANDLSQHLLVTLDSILGSTDSSRAIASIITLIRREFQNPATGKEGEKVSVADLLVGICGLALLQRWCKTITDEECREKKYEEVVWDVVILDDGRRADVVGESDKKALTRTDSMSFMSTNGDELVQTIQREGRAHEDSDDDLPEINLKEKIMRTLPPDTSVSITTETTTTKTITEEEWNGRYEWMTTQGKGGYYLLVIEDQGRIVATGALLIERKFIHHLGLVGHIEDIAVAKDQQGKKLGLKLIQALDFIAEKVGCYKCILDCSEPNEGFYVKCGYKRAGLEMAHYYDGSISKDAPKNA